jgi:hypothetical protein
MVGAGASIMLFGATLAEQRDCFDIEIGENLWKSPMQSALARLYGKIKSGLVAVIFFSGYKIQSDRQSYMIQINATQASSLYGREIAKIRSGNAAGGNSDITAAKSIDPRISEEFAKYGIQYKCTCIPAGLLRQIGDRLRGARACQNQGAESQREKVNASQFQQFSP